MTRAQHIKRAILAALKDTNPFLLPETTLFADMNLRLSEPVTKIEFNAALRELEGQKRALCVKDEDDAPKWKITDNGLARLAELG
jgi:hypothetical protein